MLGSIRQLRSTEFVIVAADIRAERDGLPSVLWCYWAGWHSIVGQPASNILSSPGVVSLLCGRIMKDDYLQREHRTGV